jgi:chorismate mutase
VARALADGLRDQLGAELRAAEAQVRARVDALVSERVAQAQTAVSAFETQVRDRVAAERQRLDQAKRELEARVRALAPGIPGIGG